MLDRAPRVISARLNSGQARAAHHDAVPSLIVSSTFVACRQEFGAVHSAHWFRNQWRGIQRHEGEARWVRAVPP
jgi:hypothetical protein